MKDHVIAHFRKKDPVLSVYAERYSSIEIVPSADHFSDLCNAIVCQQLSEKAGASIWNRFEAAFGRQGIVPVTITGRNADALRALGISWSKAGYIKNIAAAFLDGTVTPHLFTNMEDEAIIRQLTGIKGVGRWTAEMFLIFSLGREDVFSPGDLGLRRAIQKMYGYKSEPALRTLATISRKWSPYRSYASLVLWKSLTVK
jgi:DNA-3-methyladenine glycosylase II